MKQSRERTSITCLSVNIFSERTGLGKFLAIILLALATIFLVLGFYSYRDLYYREDSFAKQCNTSMAEITKWETTTAQSGRGSTKTVLITHIIDYQFETEDGKRFSGRDIVETWRDKPKSRFGLTPFLKAPIEIEYLRSSPMTSRITISNRNAREYDHSILSMIIGAMLLAITCINALPKMLRLMTYGLIFSLIGFIPLLMGLAFPFLIYFRNVIEGDPMKDIGLIFFTMIGCSSVLIALGVTPFWLGVFLLTRSRMVIEDFEDLLDAPGIPSVGNALTILPTYFYFTDAAIIVDHDNQVICFYNCHVRNGFLPWPLAIHSCDIKSLRIEERKEVFRGVLYHDAILWSSAGKTKLGFNAPGVIELLLLLGYQPLATRTVRDVAVVQG